MDQKWDNIAAFEGLEVREEGGQIHIDGYAAVFDSLSEAFEARFREVIKPGAFREVLEKEADIVALVDHEPKLPLGRRSKGTLEIREDTRGLRVSITPPDTQDVKDLTARIRRGDYGGMSFRFKVSADGERWTRENGQRIREIRNLSRMPEISIVTFPQYRETAVALRSLEQFEKEEQQEDVVCWADSERKKLDLEEES